jgi:hypothetical protein
MMVTMLIPTQGFHLAQPASGDCCGCRLAPLPLAHRYEVSQDAALVGQGTWVALVEGVRQVLIGCLHGSRHKRRHCINTIRPAMTAAVDGSNPLYVYTVLASYLEVFIISC